MTKEKVSFLNEHIPYINDPVFVELKNIVPSDIVQFSYHGDLKTVLVLNPRWHDKMHALSFRAMPRNEIKEFITESRTADQLKFYHRKLEHNRRHAYRTYNVKDILFLRRVKYDYILSY